MAPLGDCKNFHLTMKDEHRPEEWTKGALGTDWSGRGAQAREKRVMSARERPPTQNNSPDRARGCRIVDAHEAASRFLVDGHFRHDREAHAGSHHTEEATERAALKNNLRVEMGMVAHRDGVSRKQWPSRNSRNGWARRSLRGENGAWPICGPEAAQRPESFRMAGLWQSSLFLVRQEPSPVQSISWKQRTNDCSSIAAFFRAHRNSARGTSSHCQSIPGRLTTWC
jgi:hypothetical protein